MDAPSVTTIQSASKVKDARPVINDNFAALVTAIIARAGAWPLVASSADLVSLDASFLDLAGTTSGEVFILKNSNPTDLNNWIRLNGYVAPVGGIPKGDLATAVQNALTLAETAVQPAALVGLETQIGAQTKADAALDQANDYTDLQLQVQLGTVSAKQPVKVAITTNVNIANPGTSLFDGVTFANGDPILLAGETAGATNGIYVFNGSSSAMTRRSDADISAEMQSGILIPVQQGTNGNSIWQLKTASPITLDTTPLTFGPASGNTAGFATQTALTSEVNRATSAEGTLTTSIANEVTARQTLDGLVVKSVNGVTPVSGNSQIPGVYRGTYTQGAHYYVNDVVNDSGVDRRVTTEIASAPSSINLNNFASPASLSPDTTMGVPSWSGGNVSSEFNANMGWWVPRSRLKFSSTRTRLTRFRARTVADVVTTNASATVTSATAVFTTSDVGSAFISANVANGTKILTYVSATQVTLTTNATATGTAVTATISPDITSSALPAQISSDSIPSDPEGCIRLQATGFSSCTISKLLSSTVNLTNQIVRIGIRMDATAGVKSGIKYCYLEVSSNGFADGNYKYHVINARNENLIASPDTWDVVGCGPAEWLSAGTGASGDLTAINAIRIRWERDSGGPLYMSLSYIDLEPITATKAKCVIWMDDGYTSHWTVGLPILQQYGFRATVAPNILQDDAMSPTTLRNLQQNFGWQVATHARKTSEHNSINGDPFLQNLMNSKHAQNAFGLSGGDDFAWWGPTTRDLANTKSAMKAFRTARSGFGRCADTLPPINPYQTMALLVDDTWTFAANLQSTVDKAIAQKGLAQFVFHNVATATQLLKDLCVYLDANRSGIDVVTMEEAIRPYIYSA